MSIRGVDPVLRKRRQPQRPRHVLPRFPVRAAHRERQGLRHAERREEDIAARLIRRQPVQQAKPEVAARRTDGLNVGTRLNVGTGRGRSGASGGKRRKDKGNVPDKTSFRHGKPPTQYSR